ncbi:MAG: leucyl aminopeptidase family protein [Candidatus Nanohaloarchaeota archaeon]|nr:leucyl aminopeptidase family protein [Candidatus Nanohaloarchaeota archaeon]
MEKIEDLNFLKDKELLSNLRNIIQLKKSFEENQGIIEVPLKHKVYVIKKVSNKRNEALLYRAYASLSRYLASNYEISELIVDNLVTDSSTVQVISELAMLATYSSKKQELRNVILRYLHKRDSSFLKEIDAKIDAVVKAKQMLNASPTEKTPARLVKKLKDDLKKVGNVNVKVLCGQELKDWGLVNYVARGSKRDPCVIIASYMPVKDKKPVGIAGKGIIFDAGGYNYKLRWIEYMKYDMAGAIASIYTVYAVAKAGLKVNVVGAAVFAENLISEDAYKPGDIIKSLSGKTVEVGNTDAEGRLVLADLLWYFQETFDLTYLIDLATLTGASLIALGEEVAAVMGNDEALAHALQNIGLRIEERCWHLPLWDEIYKEKLRSHFADIKNISPKPWGSPIIGGMFLKYFIKPNIKWAHIDITPAAFTETHTWKGEAGATGYGIRLLYEFLKRGSQ